MLLVAIPAMLYAWLVFAGYILSLAAKAVLKERPTLGRAMLIELAASVLSMLTGVGVAILITIMGGNPNANDPLTQFVAMSTGLFTRAGVVAKMLECTLWKAFLVTILQLAGYFAILFAIGFVAFIAMIAASSMP